MKIPEKDDLISRQDAIDCVGWGDSITKVIDRIKSLPSADRPIGEWVVKDDETVCSLCGNSVSFSRTEDGWVLGKFCQTCGAKMTWNVIR